LALAAACAQPAATPVAPDPDLVQARARLSSSLDACSRETGYVPVESETLAEDTIAPGELAWRQCLYDAIRIYSAENVEMNGLYEQLIAEDISMTTAIQTGNMTRSQRRARLDALIEQIRVAEDQAALNRGLEQRMRDDQIRQIVDNIGLMR
ncbi:MAG TPA: hypothetical protein VFO41_18210, partial [Alphaproteobacteria bacterium]|nr:hypothetical protein [Alphaproteobacteria bacterium]